MTETHEPYFHKSPDEAKQDAIDEQLYGQLHELMRYDGASLKALALFLNLHRKNREFMKVASAEMGRNARHMARAVDYFRPYFEESQDCTAENYLVLFEVSRLRHEKAVLLFADIGFSLPLYMVRERVLALSARKRGPGLRERCQALCEDWKRYQKESTQANEHSAADAFEKCMFDLLKALEGGEDVLAETGGKDDK